MGTVLNFNVCVDDITLRCAPHVIEGIAGNQRYRSQLRGFQYGNIRGTHNLDTLNRVGVGLTCSINVDLVADGEVLEAAKKTIAVTGDAKISAPAHLRGPYDSADSTIQRQVVGVVIDRHLKIYLGDSQDRKRPTRYQICAAQILLDTLPIPKGKVNRGSQNRARRRRGTDVCPLFLIHFKPFHRSARRQGPENPSAAAYSQKR